MEENKITLEMAEEEFKNYCEAVDLDCDESVMSEEDLAAFLPHKEKIVKAIQKGTAIIDDDTIEYTLSPKSDGNLAGMKIKIGRPNAKMFSGMDGFKETQTVKRTQGAMSALCGLDIGVFTKMEIKDWKFFNAVCSLFLAS